MSVAGRRNVKVAASSAVPSAVLVAVSVVPVVDLSAGLW